jgi:hypothetical protein
MMMRRRVEGLGDVCAEPRCHVFPRHRQGFGTPPKDFFAAERVNAAGDQKTIGGQHRVKCSDAVRGRPDDPTTTDRWRSPITSLTRIPVPHADGVRVAPSARGFDEVLYEPVSPLLTLLLLPRGALSGFVLRFKLPVIARRHSVLLMFNTEALVLKERGVVAAHSAATRTANPNCEGSASTDVSSSSYLALVIAREALLVELDELRSERAGRRRPVPGSRCSRSHDIKAFEVVRRDRPSGRTAASRTRHRVRVGQYPGGLCR